MKKPPTGLSGGPEGVLNGATWKVRQLYIVVGLAINQTRIVR